MSAAGNPAPPPAERTLAERLNDYDDQREEREQFVSSLKEKFTEQLKAAGVETAFVEGRVKETHSLARHLAAKPKGKREDLTALRAVLLYSDQTEQAVTAIMDLLGLPTGHCRVEPDAQDELHPWEFAYRSKHLKFLPTDNMADRLGIDVPGYLRTEWFEVQVRSLAAHLWSAIDHKIRYKTPFPLKNDEARKLFMVAAQLEAVDRELDSIRASLSERIDRDGLSVLAGQYQGNRVSADGVRAMLHNHSEVVRALAIARASGWTLITRDGHEHLEGGHVNSAADAAEQESCANLSQLVASDGVRSMDMLREKVLEVLTPQRVERLLVEASARGLAAASYPADLIALAYQSVHPSAQADEYAAWQAAIEAIRCENRKTEGD